jgi:DNA-binding transcriptional ArsR family regulator
LIPWRCFVGLVYERGIKYQLTKYITRVHEMATGANNFAEDQRRAEVFDALSHPTRILILKALSAEPLGFADLKKKTGIESSGHLQHHLSKLAGLVKTDVYGKYVLSDEGKDALITVDIVERTAKTQPASQHRKIDRVTRSFVLKAAVFGIVLALSFCLILAAEDISSLSNQATTLESDLRSKDQEIAQLNEIAAQREGVWKISRAVLTVRKPSAEPLLSSVNGKPTKIVLLSTSVGYFYGPNPLPSVEWPGQPLLLDRVNGAILLPNGGLTYPDENYTQLLNNKDALVPYLVISVEVQSGYTQTDFREDADLSSYGAFLADSNVTRTELTVTLFRQDNSPVYSDIPNLTLNQTWTGITDRVLNLRNGKCDQILFYVIPSSFDFDHYEIFVSQLQPVPQT